MSTNEFDRLIAKKVSGVSYEYDANDWENLTVQLAAARRKKRALVFAYFSSGIAASVAILLISIIAIRSKKELPAIQYASTQHVSPVAPLTPSANSSVNIKSASVQPAAHYNSTTTIPHKNQTTHALDTLTNNISVAYNNIPENTSLQHPKEQIDTPGFEQKMRQHGYEEPMLSYTKTENNSGHKHINLSVAAGFNYGTINTGYAIGAAIDKKLGNKLGLEVTMAYVGNTAAASSGSSSQPPPYSPPGKPSPAPVVASSSSLNYLQFAPMANYSLSKKITLSAGADLQRLLQDHDVTVMYDNDLKVAPPIDLGMLLRTEYAIFPFLKAGLSYRLGANNIVAPGNNYLDRNYMQIQLKYKLH
ncbi:MAG: hypothetical protein JSS96_16390 [Bacteroidetes bacterium]|nr:hypothetical protein [Bacteroidota bacterium]